MAFRVDGKTIQSIPYAKKIVIDNHLVYSKNLPCEIKTLATGISLSSGTIFIAKIDKTPMVFKIQEGYLYYAAFEDLPTFKRVATSTSEDSYTQLPNDLYDAKVDEAVVHQYNNGGFSVSFIGGIGGTTVARRTYTCTVYIEKVGSSDSEICRPRISQFNTETKIYTFANNGSSSSYNQQVPTYTSLYTFKKAWNTNFGGFNEVSPGSSAWGETELITIRNTNTTFRGAYAAESENIDNANSLKNYVFGGYGRISSDGGTAYPSSNSWQRNIYKQNTRFEKVSGEFPSDDIYKYPIAFGFGSYLTYIVCHTGSTSDSKISVYEFNSITETLTTVVSKMSVASGSIVRKLGFYKTKAYFMVGDTIYYLDKSLTT